MASSVRALRGATTADADTPDDIAERMQELLRDLFDRNQVAHDDLISIVFTATGDLVSAFPAAAARAIGLGDVPLLCARELDVVGSTPHCLRVLVHLRTDKARADLHHVYLHGARKLRDDLPE
jgi:chorismate mutase